MIGTKIENGGRTYTPTKLVGILPLSDIYQCQLTGEFPKAGIVAPPPKKAAKEEIKPVAADDLTGGRTLDIDWDSIVPASTATQTNYCVKIVQSILNNDLLQAEVNNLDLLKTRKADMGYFPEVLDSFLFDKKHVSVFNFDDRTFSFEEIKNEYPGGIDPRDAVWMFNRCLEGLYFAHRSGVVHGAMIPQNILVNVDTHSGTLAEWSYSLDLKRWNDPDFRIRALVNKYRHMYPPEVTEKRKPGPETDLFMAAHSMVHLLGGDTVKGTLPASVPEEIGNFLKKMTAWLPTQRPKNAGDLREEFGGIAKDLYGKRAFRPFVMPPRK